MTSKRALMPFAIVLALTGPAAAQMYPGEGIAVNPNAAAGGKVLLYPGGKYMRVLPPLLEPGAAAPGSEVIHLHMPAPRRHVARKRAPVESVASAPVESAAPAETEIPAQAPPPPAPRKRKVAVEKPASVEEAPPAQEEAPAATDSSAAIPFSFGGPMPRQPAGPKQKQSAAPRAVAPRAAAAAPQQTEVASAEPPPVTTKMSAPSEEPSNLSKRSEILFPHNGTDPSPETLAKLKQLAGDLNSALDAGARRVQLDAFGGAPGDKSSDARRVSLKRALVIRQFLIDDGVPASRIDVRAMGGIDDNGNADRVDVYVRAG